VDVLSCFQKHHCPHTNLAWMTLHGHFLHVLLLATHKLHCLVLVNPTHALVYWHSFPLGKLWQHVTSFLSRKCYDMYLYDNLQSFLELPLRHFHLFLHVLPFHAIFDLIITYSSSKKLVHFCVARIIYIFGSMICFKTLCSLCILSINARISS